MKKETKITKAAIAANIAEYAMLQLRSHDWQDTKSLRYQLAKDFCDCLQQAELDIINSGRSA